MDARANNRVKIGVLGASGYTGAELVRLLAHHPAAEFAFLTADRQVGRPYGDVFAHLARLDLPDLIAVDDADWSAADVVFCGLPHGTTQAVVSTVLEAAPATRVVDLSADFRLRDPDAYGTWFGHPHRAPQWQPEAVYGLTEVHRDTIRRARLVANPGCYTTTCELPLVPLVKAGLIDAENIIIDAKSGVTGAGRGERLSSLHSEMSESVNAYGLAGHFHVLEMEQELGDAAGRPITITFTPHLVPMNRGILATCYVRLAGADADDLRACLDDAYADEPFVHVLPAGKVPATRDVRGSNHCRIGVAPGRRDDLALVLSVTDNLVKGASGQAVQNMNVMLDLPETAGLEQEALFP